MKTRRLGRTGLDISVVGLGCGSWIDPSFTRETSIGVLHYALNRGINFIDTAEDYDEVKVRYALLGVRDRVIISTKAASHNYKGMRYAIEQSLERLGVDVIDIYMMQSVNTADELRGRVGEGVVRAMTEARDAGTIRFIGVSGHRTDVLESVLEIDEIDVIFSPYHLGHTLGEDLFRRAAEKDVGVLAMKSLGGGFLVDPCFEHDEPAPGAREMTVRNALGYVLANGAVSSAVVGMRTIDQVDEAVEVAEAPPSLSAEELRGLSEAARRFLGDDYCRTCKHCAPCDTHGWRMDIDAILRLEGFTTIYGYKKRPRDQYRGFDLKGSDCAECGVCEAKCPYDIQISQRLKKAHELLE